MLNVINMLGIRLSLFQIPEEDSMRVRWLPICLPALGVPGAELQSLRIFFFFSVRRETSGDFSQTHKPFWATLTLRYRYWNCSYLKVKSEIMSYFSEVSRGWVIRLYTYIHIYSTGDKIWIKNWDLDSDVQPVFSSFRHGCQQMLSVQIYQSLW